ncbi:S8 family serine peptidase [Salinibacillus xinjiangensis]|uniref:S8 family serine peptidase n=1 Tax=Salinibacillus xinjiangensis TaxID=1229268 RepID=A0A6G1X9A7_9BACI|nr:S8 family serine peptidase [Salinibacillus xinjiangensis]MRG87486.1 S8 family serine peptidase [Salinibacillus xinjiangensis]
MKKVLSFLLVITIVFITLTPPVFADQEIPTERVIIVFKDEVDEKIVNRYNGDIQDEFEHIPVVAAEVPASMVDNLENNRDVVAVESDHLVQVSGQIQEWGIDTVKAPLFWNQSFSGKGIKIAIIDTGIALHEDLNIAGGVSFTSYSKTFQDDNGHGTHVAGIIGAKNNGIGTIGVAPDANLYSVKVLDHNGQGYLSDIIAGIDWAVSNQMDIINLSLGTPYDSISLKKAVDEAYANGVLVVAAGGNNGNVDGLGNTVEFPAKYDSAISVGAIDGMNARASFSATGSELEVVAPGVGIVSSYLNNRYVKMNGTSMAAPYVSGLLALLKEANPTLNAVQLRNKLHHSVMDLGVAGRDNLFGFGLVQAKVDELKKDETVGSVQEAIVVPTITKPSPAKKVEPKPVIQKPKKIVKKDLKATISTAKLTYKRGQTVWVTTKVVDSKTKKPLKGALVKLTVKPSKGKTKFIQVKTNGKGVASFKYVTNKKSAKGKYRFTALSSLSKYNTRTISKMIVVK